MCNAENLDKKIDFENKMQEDFEKESNILELDLNTKFNVKSRNDDYTVLTYGEKRNTMEVPNVLVPYFATEGNVLRYENGKFARV